MRLILIFAAAGAQFFFASALVSTPGQINFEPQALPEDYSKLLRDVKHGVEHLKVPDSQENPFRKAQSLAECSFIGNLVSAKLTPRCCTSVQVITQNKLSEYGLAKNCQKDWDCEADLKTTSRAFEARSLSELCGEPGCLPRVTKALHANWKTASGASQMSKICSQLGKLSGDANATRISGLLREPAAESANLRGEPPTQTHDRKEVDKHCEKEVCSDRKQRKDLCERTSWSAQHHNCYDTCCHDYGGVSCFPGEAMVNLERSGAVPVGNIRVGDRIQVERYGELVYEPVLAFLHTIRHGSQKQLPFLTVKHLRGEFRASATHLVFVVGKGKGSESKLVGNLEVGDQLLVASGTTEAPLVASRVVATQRSFGSLGMFAPLTASGTVVVDGVVASNYASPSQTKNLPHHYAHAFLFPVRMYHKLGLNALFKPVWAWLCPAAHAHTEDKSWICQGAGIDSESVTEAEDIHPFLAVMYKGLKVDTLLPSEV